MSLLPSSKRKELKDVTQKKIWIYGGTMTGKTTFADKFPNPLMLNTDGNTSFITAPTILITDQVTMNGRIKNEKLAWVYFKEIIEELEEKNNDFETLVVDLIEDLYEMCRLYIFDREKITHESDNPFKAWDMVTKEYLNTMQKLLNLEYDNFILISHEDLTRDITKPSGNNVTQIKPNLRDKISIKIVGMVDAVGRVLIEEENKRVLSFKTDSVTFGGSRIPNTPDKINLEYEEIKKLYKGEVK